MAIDQARPSFFILALESLALATSGLLVMADFTNPVVSTQAGFVASLAGLSEPVKKNSSPINQNGGKII
jgi:hypothetical protein